MVHAVILDIRYTILSCQHSALDGTRTYRKISPKRELVSVDRYERGPCVSLSHNSSPSGSRQLRTLTLIPMAGRPAGDQGLEV